MKNLLHYIFWIISFSTVCCGNSESVTKTTIQITNEYTLPLPVYIERGIEYLNQLQFAVRIEAMFIDGEKVTPMETSAVVESDIVPIIASGTKWHTYQLSFGEYSANLIPVELPWESYHFYNWAIPESWETVKVEYSFHDSSGRFIDDYEVTYIRSNVQPVAGGDATR